jgi:hypothetical protein
MVVVIKLYTSFCANFMVVSFVLVGSEYNAVILELCAIQMDSYIQFTCELNLILTVMCFSRVVGRV